MKTAVRNVIGDLVEKRLWPVAIALIVAIVAVPVLLARGGAPETAPPADTGAAPGAGQAAVVRLVEPDTAARERAGRVRNPFGAASASTATTAAATTAASTATASATAASGSTSPASSAAGTSSSAAAGPGSGSSAGSPTTASSTPAPAATTTTPRTTTTPKTGTSATYSVAVRFGRTDGTRRTLRDVARLTALPNGEAPVLSLLGVLRDGRTAVLKVAANTTASGSGTCKPSASSCTTVEMKAGDAEYLSVARDGGAPLAWYYLKLLHVDRHETASKAVAKAAYARRSAAGMAVVRRDAASVRAYRYLPGAGVLVRAARRTGSAAKAAKVAQVGGASLLPADRQPGVPVWRSAPRSAKP